MERAGRPRHRRAGRRLSEREQRNKPPLPFRGYFLYAGTSGSSGGRRPSSSSSFKGRISEGVAPQGNFKIFQKTLDAISFFAAKGGSPICVYAHARREKTN